MRFGVLIQTLALLKYGSVREFEKQTGFSRRTIDTWIARESNMPHRATVQRAAEIFGFNVQDLMRASRGNRSQITISIEVNTACESEDLISDVKICLVVYEPVTYTVIPS